MKKLTIAALIVSIITPAANAATWRFDSKTNLMDDSKWAVVSAKGTDMNGRSNPIVYVGCSSRGYYAAISKGYVPYNSDKPKFNYRIDKRKSVVVDVFGDNKKDALFFKHDAEVLQFINGVSSGKTMVIESRSDEQFKMDYNKFTLDGSNAAFRKLKSFCNSNFGSVALNAENENKEKSIKTIRVNKMLEERGVPKSYFLMSTDNIGIELMNLSNSNIITPYDYHIITTEVGE